MDEDAIFDVSQLKEYDDFIINNRIKVNKYLNRILFAFVVTGPAIAIGISRGVFIDTSYSTCIGISVFVVMTFFIHHILVKRFPTSVATSIFALITLDVLLVYMTYNHVAINITWFLVPVLSIMFCDKKIYLSTVIMNYLCMSVATWLTSPYYSAFQSDGHRAALFFMNRMGGFTIESLVMFFSGQLLNVMAISYYRSVSEQHKVIKQHDIELRKELDILDSMVKAYDNVNLLNFYENTEMSLRDKTQKKYTFDLSKQTQTKMNQNIRKTVMPDQLDDFMKFTDIQTVRRRLTNKKIISADFIDVVTGWFRAQYISVESAQDGIPNLIIYTTRNVDEDKRREEHLIRLTLTDELTRLYNRRCYDADLEKYIEKGMDDDFVILSMDVNGLKKINDTMGHAAGDELIKGASDCLSLVIRNNGKAYRTGGDEFMAIVHTEDPESICSEIRSKAAEWHGMYSDKMTMSVGYATHRENISASINELEHIADSRMYEDKERYYRESGLDRRR